MANETKTAPKTAPKVAKPKAERYQANLKSAKGGELLRFKAEKQKSGPGYISFIFHSLIGPDGKKKPGKGRGVTQAHADFASARAAVDSAVQTALSLGWIKPVRAVGTRPDAFDLKSIPVPTK